MECFPGPSRPSACGRDDNTKLECQSLPDRPKSPFPEIPNRRPLSAFSAPWAFLKPAPEAAAGAGIALPCLLFTALFPTLQRTGGKCTRGHVGQAGVT